jgi:predicted dehydrogenase
MSAKLRWGILGTGNIAGQFTAGVLTSRRGVATAVGSRNASTAQAFAAKYEIARSHGSYEAFIADPNVDAIYNSTPNSLHAEWTIRALQAGKHVLCEKPIGMGAAEAERMFDAAKHAGRVLMEAFMYRTHPQTLAVMDAVKSGAIGQLRLIRTSFCYRTRKIRGNVRFVRELGGGGLMDIGCYCISFARFFAGEEPTSFSAIAKFHAASGVDELAAGTLVFPSGIISSFSCGMCAHADNTAYLCGTEGFIEIPVPWKPMSGSTFIITRGIEPKMDRPSGAAASGSAAPPREVRTVEFSGNLYGIEADDFAAAALDGDAPRISREESIGNMRVLDEMRRQIGLKF